MPDQQAKKVKGVADIIFLLDATGSMQPCINDVKNNIANFLESLKKPENPNEVTPIRDWRAAVYAYRDYNADGADKWFIANPFTRDPAVVREQLDALVADGGGDEPEDLLDALLKIGHIGETEKGASPEMEDPFKWRYHSQAARCVVVFTDATFHTELASAPGNDKEDVKNAIEMSKIRVSIYAPDFGAVGFSGYDDLSIDKLEYEPIPLGPSDDPRAVLAAFTGDRKNFKKTLAQLAKSVSASAETDTLDICELEEVATPEVGADVGMDGATGIPDFGSGFSDVPTDA